MDAATDAEIARILAEEQGLYGYEYAYLDDDIDSDNDPDYGSKRKKKPLPRKPKQNKHVEHVYQAAIEKVSAPAQPAMMDVNLQPRGEIGAIDSPATYSTGVDGLSATGRRKRKDTGATRTASRAWSDEEENLFQEALALYGRDWKRCAEHIGTRDARAVASHTQKYLIKALLRGEELPEAMAKTGRGYTLSGKPLDPNSSAAKAYGLRPKEFLKVIEKGFLQVGVHVTTFEVDSTEGGTGAKSTQGEKPNENGSHNIKLVKKKVEELPESPPKPTDYSLNRPRRTLNARAHMGDTTESLDLTALQEFMGPVGSEGGRCQPFEVILSTDAVLVMDFHAHLSSWEVIGLLGGTFDPEKRILTIKAAFPCRRAAGSDSGTSVELDPACQVEVTSEMGEQGLVPVGWYHSHPIFEARPSAKDNENQRNYQALCRDNTTGLEPWVGIIMGPYDQRLPTPASQVQAWVVRHQNRELIPFNIRSKRYPLKATPTPEIEKKLETALLQLKGDVAKVNMQESWRPYTFLLEDGPKGAPLTRAEKLKAALKVHLDLNMTAEVDTFLQKIDSLFEMHWGTKLLSSA